MQSTTQEMERRWHNSPLVVSALVVLMAGCAFGEYNHNIQPSCAPEEKICNFTWHISKLETLVWYDHVASKGYPVVSREGALQLRDPDVCNKTTPIKKEQLRDVFTADGVYRYVYTVNNEFPGPSIVVYEGQQVSVRVRNGLLQEGTTLHWHGLPQHRTNFMDGAGSVTQCPINPGETFVYRFLATPAGTHWWHAHVGLQRTDGLSGALIVLPRPPKPTPAPTTTTTKAPTTTRTTTTTTTQAETTAATTTADATTVDASVNRIVRDTEVHRANPKFHGNKDTDENTSLDKSPSQESGNATTPSPPSPLPSFSNDFVFLVHDWFHEDSDDIFVSYYSEIAKYLWDGYNNTDMCHTRTQQQDGGEVGTIPFQSALINGKGQYKRHYQEAIQVPLESFTVRPGGFYRFRAINTGMNFAMRISIDQHKLHVVASDGMDLKEVVADSVIVHGGERYDFYIQADQPLKKYHIHAQTMEVTQGEIHEWDSRMISPGGTTAILHYEGVADEDEPDSEPRPCTQEDLCVVVNCPFKEYPDAANSTCINFNDLKSKTPNDIGETTGVEEHFLNFHFPRGKGDILRSQVNGIQFEAPDTPPTVSNGAVYMNGCDLEECDREPCHCTYQVNITKGNEVIMVLTSTVTDIGWQGLPATVHPVHLHGHHFQVLKTGYATLDPVTKRYAALNPDIRCTTSRCHKMEWTNQTWSNGHIPGINAIDPPLKDTVTVPVGGYVVIRFAANNPGWWIMHCHVELHQVEGMALIIQEGEPEDMNKPPSHFPTCGWFDWSAEDFERAISGSSPQVTGSLLVCVAALMTTLKLL